MGKVVTPTSGKSSMVKNFNIWEAILVLLIVVLLAGVAAFTFTDYTEPPTVEGQTQYATFRLTGSVAVFLVVGAGMLFGLKMIKAIMAPVFLLAAAFIVGPEIYHQDQAISIPPPYEEAESAEDTELKSEVMALRKEIRTVKDENLKMRQVNERLKEVNATLRNNPVYLDSQAAGNADVQIIARVLEDRQMLIKKNDSLAAVNKRLQRIISIRE